MLDRQRGGEPAVGGVEIAHGAVAGRVVDVLEAVVDGWQVRNGAIGNGDQRFVTVGELGSITGANIAARIRVPSRPTPI